MHILWWNIGLLHLCNSCTREFGCLCVCSLYACGCEETCVLGYLRLPHTSWPSPADSQPALLTPTRLLGKLTQTGWGWASSQETLNASEGPDHLTVVSSTFRRWRNSLVNRGQQTCFQTGSPACRNTEQGRAALFSSSGAVLGDGSWWTVQYFEGHSSWWRMGPLQIWVMCLLLICILMASLKQMQIEFQTKDIATAATVVNDLVFENWHCHTHLQVYILHW